MGHEDGHHYDLFANDLTKFPNYKSVSVKDIVQASQASETRASDDSDIMNIQENVPTEGDQVDGGEGAETVSSRKGHWIVRMSVQLHSHQTQLT